MLTRHDPFRELERLADDMFGARATTAMPLDAFRRGDHVVVEMDLPGVDPDTIDLSVHRNALTVRAERKWSPREGDRFFIRERSHGTVARQVYLGDDLDSDAIEAEYHAGVLTITVPVRADAKPRQIKVRGLEAIEAGSSEK